MSLPLLHSPADIVRWLMVASGQSSDPTLATLGQWPAWVDVETDTPDAQLVISDTTGQSDGRDMVDGSLNQHYGIQVRIRSVGKPDGFTKAQSLRTWMSEQVLGAVICIPQFGPAVYVVTNFSKVGQVLSLGRDMPNSVRWLHTINGYASIRRLDTIVLLNDAFAGTTGVSVAARAMNTGPGWTVDAGGFNLTGNNSARQTTLGGNIVSSNAGTDAANGFVTVRVPSGSSAGAAGILGRLDSGSHNGWLAWLDVVNGTLNLSERTSSFFQSPTSVPFAAKFDTNYQVGLQFDGNNVAAVLNGGILGVSVVSSHNVGNTRWGIYADTSINQLFSNFLAYNR